MNLLFKPIPLYNTKQPLFNEDFLNEQHPQDNTDLTGWNPSRRSSTTLPHPSEVQQTRFTDYAFPPIRRNSAIHTLFEDIASVPMLPEVSEEPFYREQRSMSYSFTTQDDAKLFNHHHLFLDTIMQEEDEEDDQQQQDESKRTRSKSSAAIMDIWHPSLKEDDAKKWTMANNISGRRSSLIPPSLLDQEDEQVTGIRERIRRFSLAPPSTAFMENTNYHNQQHRQQIQQQQQHTLASPSFFMNQRRHSLAGPTNSTNYNNNNQLPSLNQTSSSSAVSASNQQQDIISDLAVRERFSPPNDHLANSMILPQPSKSDIIKIDDMGKGTRLDSEILNDAVFYVVEFKGGRSDVFYSQQKTIKEHNLVIVEADRGRDLGKITMENISRQQLEIFYSQLKNNNNQNPTTEEKKKYLPNEIYVKCIFRQARSDEITLLMAKGQDEAKALMVCQSKIKQKKLNMQVVDAEYQWYEN